MERKSLQEPSQLSISSTPSVAGGTVWKRDWFRKISVPEFLGIKNKDVIIHFFMDTAYTKNTGNDPSGQIAACHAGNYMYITDAISVYKELSDLIRWIPEYEGAWIHEIIHDQNRA